MFSTHFYLSNHFFLGSITIYVYVYIYINKIIQSKRRILIISSIVISVLFQLKRCDTQFGYPYSISRIFCAWLDVFDLRQSTYVAMNDCVRSVQVNGAYK